jgi:hypothetical protein
MADGLEHWNFHDEAANGTEGLVNRQKSALNLVVIALDQAKRTGVFLDREKKIQSSTSLTSCDCRDFHFVGRGLRKTPQPCKHIYRLAMELGLLEPKYLDHEAREAFRQRGLGELKRIEDDRLLSLGRDPGQWGGWPALVHASGLQKNRQYRAYFIVDDEPECVKREQVGWRVREYAVTLDNCECADFQDRRLPCKHIYVATLESGIPLLLSRREYAAARQRGLEILLEFDCDQPDSLSRF